MKPPSPQGVENLPGGPAELSRREREVAALVGQGLTDKEIAGRLFLSPRTVEGHLQSIRNKLGFDNRAQVAAWVAREPEQAARPSPSGLPGWLTAFVGRQAELERIPPLLERTRAVTITGPGGAGKTRLALRLAGDLLSRHPATWFVDLSTIQDASLVLPAVATALGVEEFSSVAGLIVLDNCEHVIERAAEAADQLLHASPRVLLLATSREPLLFDGEAVWRLEPLPEEDAAILFEQRANLSDPSFELNAKNASLVADLCRRLDGIPLALELAAAQVGPLGLEAVREHLDALRRRAGPERHQTLEAAIGWSYELLSVAEQRLLRRLSVFRGGFSEEAVAAICGPDAELLPELARKSMVMAAGGDRWALLETIRAFAEARLEESGEAAAIRSAHAELYLALATQAVLTGAAQSLWLPRLEAEHDNFRAALASSADPRLAVALHRFWLLRGHLSEGRAWLEQVGSPDEPEVHNAIAGIAWRQGDYAAARTHLLAALAGWERVSDSAGQQRSLANLGVLAASQGDFKAAVEHYRLSLSLADQPRAIAILRSNLGLALAELGSFAEAASLLDSALSVVRSLEEPALIGATLANLGVLALNRGETAAARQSFLEALEVLQGIGDTPDAASCFEGLACVEALEGNPARARELVEQAEEIRAAIGSRASAAQRARLERYALQV